MMPLMPPKDSPSVLHSVAPMLSKQVTTDKLLKTMVDQVVEELGAERGTLFLVDAITGELRSRVAHLPELKEIRLPPGTGVAGHVAETGEAVVVPDASKDSHFFPGVDEATGYKTRNMLAVPVRDGEGAIRGVLQVLNRKKGNFKAHDKELLGELAGQVAQALEQTSMRPCGDRSRGVLLNGPFNNFIGECPAMQTLYQRIEAAATTDANVLVRGDTGTGKTLVARAIHDNSNRRDGPLVLIDCTNLPPGLIESEMFGHERGAFTGADRRVPGKVELADGGTIFLDEIGDLPLALQGKLLRFLQDYSFERLGGRKTIKTDVRVIAATNQNLEELIQAGKFRKDLYYRLKVVELIVPPLCERGPGDIEKLAGHFLDQFARRHRRKALRFSPEAMIRLCSYMWPGNVRELEHCVESAVVLCRGEEIEEDMLSLPKDAEAAGTGGGYPPGMPLRDVEREHILRTLKACNNNRTEAARRLGIGRNTLARKLTDK